MNYFDISMILAVIIGVIIGEWISRKIFGGDNKDE